MPWLKNMPKTVRGLERTKEKSLISLISNKKRKNCKDETKCWETDLQGKKEVKVNEKKEKGGKNLWIR